MRRTILNLFWLAGLVWGQVTVAQDYPKGYFRSPLNIPMALVANFGEIRPNHWHMGLDVRTQQRVNLPVYASADGYIAHIKVEPGGFGQAIYINHPNGYTTLYAHLNTFFPALAGRIKEEQYKQESWKIDLDFSSEEFPVKKSDYIGLSGSTGASAGPHVHFEIRDTKTDKVLNPLLFGFPIPDAVPPSIVRLAMYDRNKSTYAQSPQLLNIAKTRNSVVKVGSDKISFAIGATDRFTGSANPNGFYSATVYVDEHPVSSFALNNIGYDETRYINAQLDYPLMEKGGGHLQHIAPLPGATGVAYTTYGSDGLIHLTDENVHEVLIEVKDANGNSSRIPFKVQYDMALAKTQTISEGERFIPNQINVFERESRQPFEEGGFQLVTSEKTIYDTVTTTFIVWPSAVAGSVSPQYNFLTSMIPFHDSVTVRIKPGKDIAEADKEHIVIKNVSGNKTVVQKAVWQSGWLMAKFRQAGSYQAFVDNAPPTVNNATSNLSKAVRIVFTPADNFNSIKSFRCEVDGQWLRFSNDKGHSWVYTFDEKFPLGEHELKVRIEDEAGNVMEKVWKVKR